MPCSAYYVLEKKLFSAQNKQGNTAIWPKNINGAVKILNIQQNGMIDLFIFKRFCVYHVLEKSYSRMYNTFILCWSYVWLWVILSNSVKLEYS